MPRGPRQTHGKRSSDGRLTLAPRMGGVRDAARPAANAWKTLERRSADARTGATAIDAARCAPPRSVCINRLRIVAEPSSELRVCARNLQTVSLIVKLTYFSQTVRKLSSNFFAVQRFFKYARAPPWAFTRRTHRQHLRALLTRGLALSPKARPEGRRATTRRTPCTSLAPHTMYM